MLTRVIPPSIERRYLYMFGVVEHELVYDVLDLLVARFDDVRIGGCCAGAIALTMYLNGVCTWLCTERCRDGAHGYAACRFQPTF